MPSVQQKQGSSSVVKIVWITHLTETGVLLAIRIPFLASFLTAPRTVKRQVLRYGNVQADAPGILGRGEGKERKPYFRIPFAATAQRN